MFQVAFGEAVVFEEKALLVEGVFVHSLFIHDELDAPWVCHDSPARLACHDSLSIFPLFLSLSHMQSRAGRCLSISGSECNLRNAICIRASLQRCRQSEGGSTGFSRCPPPP